MARYTEQLQNIHYEISMEDENYTEKLLAVVRMFREYVRCKANILIRSNPRKKACIVRLLHWADEIVKKKN